MMTQDQADAVVDALVAGFPQKNGLNDKGMMQYADGIIDCGADYDKAHEIAKRWSRTHEFFPRLAEFLAVIAPRPYVTADPDDTFIHPDVMRGIQRVWREKMAEVDKRRTGRGPDGHWHGGPDPCPVCGGMKVAAQ